MPPPAPIKYMCAMYTYAAQEQSELSFQESDIIEVIAEDESGWWLGYCGGKVGLFPIGYTIYWSERSVAYLKVKEFRAKYDYNAEATEELSFKKGDVIKVISEDITGWWEGTLRGKTGLFPINYMGITTI